jgi:hypothetical protein
MDSPCAQPVLDASKGVIAARLQVNPLIVRKVGAFTIDQMPALGQVSAGFDGAANAKNY